MTPAEQIADGAVKRPGTTWAVVVHLYERSIDCGDEIAAAVPDTMIRRRIRSAGQQAIELHNGSRILQRTATGRTGMRGRRLDGLWLDGPLSDEARAALLPCITGGGLLVES